MGCACRHLRRRARPRLARPRCSSCLGRPDPSAAAAGTGVDPRCRLRDRAASPSCLVRPAMTFTGSTSRSAWSRQPREKARAAGVAARFEVGDAQAPAVEAGVVRRGARSSHPVGAARSVGGGALVGGSPQEARRARARRGPLVDRGRPDCSRVRAPGSAPSRGALDDAVGRPSAVGQADRRRALPAGQPTLTG